MGGRRPRPCMPWACGSILGAVVRPVEALQVGRELERLWMLPALPLPLHMPLHMLMLMLRREVMVVLRLVMLRLVLLLLQFRRRMPLRCGWL